MSSLCSFICENTLKFFWIVAIFDSIYIFIYDRRIIKDRLSLNFKLVNIKNYGCGVIVYYLVNVICLSLFLLSGFLCDCVL